MTVLNIREMRDEKIQLLKQGRTVYAESPEFIRIIKRGIAKEEMDIAFEECNGGCWFIPEVKQTID